MYNAAPIKTKEIGIAHQGSQIKVTINMHHCDTCVNGSGLTIGLDIVN